MTVFAEVASAKYKGGGDILIYDTTRLQIKETVKRLTQVRLFFIYGA